MRYDAHFISVVVFIISILLLPFQNYFYRFSASSEEERSEWISLLAKSLREDATDFHKVVERKKAALRRKSMQVQHDIPGTQTTS